VTVAEPTILFIYGSLKRGHLNHHRLAGQHYLGDATTEASYRIVQLGKYGGLIRDAATGLAVTGELWAVGATALGELDDFEQGEGLWARSPVAVTARQKVEAYFWVGDVPDGVRSGAEWPLPGEQV